MNKNSTLFEDIILQNEDYSYGKLEAYEYYRCEFRNCIFTEASLRGSIFEDCSFINCDLSMVKLVDVGFQNANFHESKLLGVDFTVCKKFVFSLSFKDCILNYSNFEGTKLVHTTFDECSLVEVDFSRCNLSNSRFLDCDMSGSIFQQTNLEKVDMRTAHHFTIDPDNNRIKRTKFRADNLLGLLYKYDLDIG